MYLSTKNKQQMTMQNLIKETEKIGGVPKEFEFSKKEFGNLLVELNAGGKTVDSFKFCSDDDSLLIKIYRETFTNESVNKLIKDWIAGKIEASYVDIPIVHKAPVVPKPEKKTEGWDEK